MPVAAVASPRVDDGNEGFVPSPSLLGPRPRDNGLMLSPPLSFAPVAAVALPHDDDGNDGFVPSPSLLGPRPIDGSLM